MYFKDVTDRRRVEEERQHFAALVDATPDFICVAGLDQRGLYVNRAGMEPGTFSCRSRARVALRACSTTRCP